MPRERTFRTEGLILRRIDFGEADRLLTLYTREHGKIRAIAKGARKPQSRKTGHVELFMRTRFLVAKGKSLDIITQAELVETYPPLRNDLVRATYASYAVELLDRLTPEDDPHPEIFNLLANAFGWFSGDGELHLAARYYELRLLSLVGYQPQLFRCVVTGEPIEEVDQFLSAELGGLISPGHRGHDRRSQPISAVAVKVLRYLQTRSWDTVRVLQLRRPLQAELEGLMHAYLTYILERNLKSVDFLRRLREEAALFAPDPEE
jgi:DNA repair protein RecO (recombination protein O)